MKRFLDIHPNLFAAGLAGALRTRRMTMSAGSANQIPSLVVRFLR